MQITEKLTCARALRLWVQGYSSFRVRSQLEDGSPSEPIESPLLAVFCRVAIVAMTQTAYHHALKRFAIRNFFNPT